MIFLDSFISLSLDEFSLGFELTALRTLRSPILRYIQIYLLGIKS
jgi:hypothetical protein